MDLIERYLAAIGRQLPAKQAGDIKAELRDLLLSQVEEREAKLGRPLVKPEVEALLIEFGNPLSVAGRYRKTQHLIGPEVFPYWWAAIKVMLAVLAGVYVVLIVIGVASGVGEKDFNRHVPSVAMVAIYLFGLITLGAAAFERFGKVGALQAWKPSRLPPAVGKRRSAFDLTIEIGWNVVFLAWWLGAFRFRDLIHPPYPDFMDVSMAPVWAEYRLPIVVFIAAEIAADVLALAMPGRTTLNAAILTVRYLYGMAVLGMILQAGHWVAISAPTMTEHSLPILQANFDKGMRIGIIVTIACMALRIGLELWRAWRARQAMLEPVQA